MAEEILIDEEQEDECPKCPPAGAPAWMATFADMATLLMAFFVLILSFAEFNVPKFKQISGSLREAFGVQKVVPVVEQPKGTTVISLEFSPNPSPAITDTLRQETTELQQDELKLETKNDDAPEGSEADKNKTADFDGEGGKSSEQLQATELAKQLENAINSGDLTVEAFGEKVVIDFAQNEMSEGQFEEFVAESLQAINEVRDKSGAAETEVLFGGLEKELEKLASALEQQQPNNGENSGGSSIEDLVKSQNASRATEELTTALEEQIDQGLVQVEQRENTVFVTVGAGGAFPSGTADLTPEAQRILDRISLAAMSPEGTISVTGHTDDVPISNGKFRDNWDLAAGRAASVVQAIQQTGLINGDRLSAISKGEMNPLADNLTPEGRAENRRIEIEISY
jgi:chemotaxis protein MotB